MTRQQCMYDYETRKIRLNNFSIENVKIAVSQLIVTISVRFGIIQKIIFHFEWSFPFKQQDCIVACVHVVAGKGPSV